MRIALATTQAPFISGGAELMADQLARSLMARGHEVDTISVPFTFNNKDAINQSIEYWEKQSFNSFDVGHVDKVICLKFPAYYLNHPNKTVWLTHQHRGVYDLWDTPFGDDPADEAACRLREDIIQRDTTTLGQIKDLFTISREVSERLLKFNGIRSEHLYQPSPLAGLLSPGDQYPYIFCPSRLETLKRQDLLIRAAAVSKTPVNILICGVGGMSAKFRALADELNLGKKVRFLGHVSTDEMVRLYRNALGVFFGPMFEDYGFVTLEAMQSAKPVITCVDSGGPLEFVVPDETGFVVEPDPEAIAEKMDALYSDRKKARQIGLNASEEYESLGLSWHRVVDKLESGNTGSPR